MRLWSVHPKYLDRQGLIACWREGLLAQKVLQGGTKGYKNHPQIERFKAVDNPLGAIATYLWAIADEAERRGYRFDTTKLCAAHDAAYKIEVTDKQLDYEWCHLLNKLVKRSPALYYQLLLCKQCDTHPLFTVVAGEVEAWERR